MDKEKIMTVAKGAVVVAGIGITLVQSWFNKKELDETVSKKVAEALADKAGES